METWKIVVIVAVAVVALLLIIGIIVLIKKHGKNNTDAIKTMDDRELISENARSIESLIILAKENDELAAELRKIQEKIKYLIPSEDGKVRDFDKKIKAAIEDLRISLVKADPDEPNKKVESHLMQLKLAISDRDVKV